MDLPTPNMMKIWQFQSGIVCHNRLGDRDHHHKCWGEDIVTTQKDPNPPDIVHKNNLLLPFQFEKHACDRPKRHPNVFYLVLRTEEPNKIYWSNWTIHMIQIFQIWSNFPQERSNPVWKKNCLSNWIIVPGFFYVIIEAKWVFPSVLWPAPFKVRAKRKKNGWICSIEIPVG